MLQKPVPRTDEQWTCSSARRGIMVVPVRQFHAWNWTQRIVEVVKVTPQMLVRCAKEEIEDMPVHQLHVEVNPVLQFRIIVKI